MQGGNIAVQVGVVSFIPVNATNALATGPLRLCGNS